MKEFNDIKDQIKDSHLLLGNGFSIAYNKNIFSYDSILKEIKDTHQQILNKLNTANIEFAMKHIDNCINTIKVVDSSKQATEINSKLSTLKEEFKSKLQSAITTLHPANQTIVKDDNKKLCQKWLKTITNNFSKKIFTLNFDLLLYWTLLQDIENNKKLRDNFQNKQQDDKCYFSNSGGTKTVLFLHGALHLFHDIDGTYKIVYHDHQCLVEEISNNISKNNYPLCVINGTSTQKFNDINRNHYLRTCFTNLSKIRQDSLVTYGWSWADNDQHIIHAILKNKTLKTLYIGCFGEEEYNRIQPYITNQKSQNLNIIYFDTSTVNPWQRDLYPD